MLERVISGFQTGADIAGIRAAVQAGFRVGGTMPKGFLTEAGPQPDYAWRYGATEHASTEYPPRTAQNVSDSQATLLFSSTRAKAEPGCQLTRTLCARMKRPMVEVRVGDPEVMSTVKMASLLQKHGFETINIAGTRGSSDPPMGEWDGVEIWVYAYLLDVFTRLRG